MNHKTVAIIGAGRVGSSVGFLLRRAGYPVTGVAARTAASAHKASAFIGSGETATDVVKAASTADIVFLTTPDGAIKTVCDTIASGGGFRAGSLVVHMSGAHSLDLLDGNDAGIAETTAECPCW
jgi:prephenate dehydrogenase